MESPLAAEEPEWRVLCSGADVDRTDGLRVKAGAGWWLPRASGTESKLALCGAPN